MINAQIRLSEEGKKLYEQIAGGMKSKAVEQGLKLLYKSELKDIFFTGQRPDKPKKEEKPSKNNKTSKVQIGWE